MDAHLFRRFTDELAPLLQKARLEKIQSPSPDVYAFVFFTSQGKRQLCLRFGRQHSFVFLTERRLSAEAAPPAYVMRLRKYVQGHRLISMIPLPFQRKLWLFFECPPDTEAIPALLLDLREGVSLSFFHASDMPEEETVPWPDKATLASAIEDWRHWPVLTPALRRTLNLTEQAEAAALLRDLEEGHGDIFSYYDKDDTCAALSAWPLPQALRKELREVSTSDVLTAFEAYGQRNVFLAIVTQEQRLAEQKRQQQLKKISRLEKKLLEEEQRLTSMCAAQKEACRIRDNLWHLEKTKKTAEIVLTDENGASVSVRLDARYTIQENMERLFHTAQRGKRGLVYLNERKEAVAKERSLVEASALAVQEKDGAPGVRETVSLPAHVQGFVSSDGFLILRGRNDKGNLACRKSAKGHDIWLHVTDGPGAHVIVRLSWPGQSVPERTLDEAGTLAANKSWQQQNAQARVQYAEIRHIKPMKGAAKGTVKIDKILYTRTVPVDATLEDRLMQKK
ncbi:MAG: DUF814 domain-containing protein [Desulfovibrionaceae bacterium]|nr:DUF814 domain-containing protein [Desulfovibrionaceae bacterium]